MHVYFVGIGGVGLGPLAEICLGAGYRVSGSDLAISLMTEELSKIGVHISQDQTGANLATVNSIVPVNWLVYSSGIPENHPELAKARELGIHISKRSELLNHVVRESGAELIAIAGTHGKTSTTAMLAWALDQVGLVVSYSIGAKTNFGPSGRLLDNSQYFVYECDEFDRNFLDFSPNLSIITSIDYDHPDTYPTRQDYAKAFEQFIDQTGQTVMWERDANMARINTPVETLRLHDDEVQDINLPGEHVRANATLVMRASEYLVPDYKDRIKTALESFPGVARRFEKLADGIYTDYGHHPSEIAATLELASEVSEHVVLVYQPHQNLRQHNIRSQYRSCMEKAEKIYWLPTYETREVSGLEILAPEQLTEYLTNRASVDYANLDENLWQNILAERASGKLVLCMGAGNIDSWLRQHLASPES